MCHADLTYHILQGDVAEVAACLAGGVDPNQRPSMAIQHSPLQLAVEQQSVPMVEALLTHGANPSPAGNGALRASVETGNRSILQMLIAHRADVNALGDNGDSALHVACRVGFTKAARLLLAHGANVSAAGNDTADTALHCSVQFNRPTITAVLLVHGADTHAENVYGSRPGGGRLNCGEESKILIRDNETLSPFAVAEKYRLGDEVASAARNGRIAGWRRSMHRCNHPGVRRAVHTLLLLHARFAAIAAHCVAPALPTEMWLHVAGFLLRRHWETPDD